MSDDLMELAARRFLKDAPLVERAGTVDDNGWIPTSERLPPLGERVLIWVAKPNEAGVPPRVEAARFWRHPVDRYLCGFEDDGERCWNLGRVTHWMPLPEPPTDG